MIQTYQGYFEEDGRFVHDGLFIKLPTRRRAIVNVFDDEITNEKAEQTDITLLKRYERIKLILATAVVAENDILTDTDWEEMANLRSQTNIGLLRTIDI